MNFQWILRILDWIRMKTATPSPPFNRPWMREDMERMLSPLGEIQFERNLFNIAEEEVNKISGNIHTYLLDVDGHGLSCRFYPLLKSRSLVFNYPGFTNGMMSGYFPRFILSL